MMRQLIKDVRDDVQLIAWPVGILILLVKSSYSLPYRGEVNMTGILMVSVMLMQNTGFDKPSNLSATNYPNLIDTTRKLSCSVLLNDDFSGGEFDTAFVDTAPLELKKQEIKPKQGDMILFPSYLPHRVRPVRVGTRYSLVLWFAGPPLV